MKKQIVTAALSLTLLAAFAPASQAGPFGGAGGFAEHRDVVRIGGGQGPRFEEQLTADLRQPPSERTAAAGHQVDEQRGARRRSIGARPPATRPPLRATAHNSGAQNQGDPEYKHR